MFSPISKNIFSIPLIFFLSLITYYIYNTFTHIDIVEPLSTVHIMLAKQNLISIQPNNHSVG